MFAFVIYARTRICLWLELEDDKFCVSHSQLFFWDYTQLALLVVLQLLWKFLSAFKRVVYAPKWSPFSGSGTNISASNESGAWPFFLEISYVFPPHWHVLHNLSE